MFHHEQWWTCSLSCANWMECVMLVAEPHGATPCRRVKQVHKEMEHYRELWDNTSMTALERGTRLYFTSHLSTENPGNSFNNFQSDLMMNFWERLGWHCAELESVSQDLLLWPWTYCLLPEHWFPHCQGEIQTLHLTGVLCLASEIPGT